MSKFAVPDEKPARGRGRRVGVDFLPTKIANGYYYRLTRIRKAEIQKKIAEKRAAGDRSEEAAPKKREVRKKEVYCVTNRKYYSVATEEEMSHVDAHTGDDFHRVVQCKIRWVAVFGSVR